MSLIKPAKLNPGDTVALVSLSWGGAGDPDLLWRYNLGKQRLHDIFRLKTVDMPNTLKGSAYLYEHPEKRAQDLMDAFSDKSINAIFSCIGGSESVRILPFIDYNVIRNNPKVFMGYSDTTVSHMICFKAGLSSFYGPSILGEFAENGNILAYTKQWVHKTLFSNEIIGTIDPPAEWTSEHIPWLEANKNQSRNLQKNTGYELLQGRGHVKGPLLGGCIEVLEMLKGTELWPGLESWKGALLFLETSEDKPEPSYIEYWLRNYGSQGILQNCCGILFGKPYDQQYYEEYKSVILKVVATELGLYDLPILYNVGFGHASPMAVLPYGAVAEIDCDTARFTVTESGVV